MHRRRATLLALCLLLAAASAAGAGVNHKLNQTLAGGKGDIGGVGRFVDQPFAISPDSRWVVYLADQDTHGVYELWSVPVWGGTAVKLNAPLTAGGDISGASGDVDYTFRISPDSRRVVYVADQDTDEVYELYSVPIEGGPVVKLNPPLAGGAGDVRGSDIELESPFMISPDSRHVVYVADQDSDEVFELYSVPIEGGHMAKLNPRLAAGAGDIAPSPAPYAISPDGRRVVYVADQDEDQVFELYAVAIGGGPAIKLSAAMARGGDVQIELPAPFRISPNGRRVVYVADQESDGADELWSVSIAGGEVAKLNPSLAGGAGDIRREVETAYAISPDSRWVVYLADQQRDEVVGLYSVPIEGGAAIALEAGGAGAVRGADETVANPFRISPDSQRVVYIADRDTAAVHELYSVAITGGGRIKLNPPLAGGAGDIRGAARQMANPFRISPDGRRVVYLADQETDGLFELWSVPIAGGASVKLNPRLADGRGQIRGADNMVADAFLITPDSRHVLYLADQDLVGVMELHLVAIEGGAARKLNPTLANEQGAIVGADYELNHPFRISPDGRWAVYVADQESDEVIELFASRLFGLNVRGNGIDIVGGDRSPRPQDGTDFGTSGVGSVGVVHRFEIASSGAEPIALGAGAISIEGPAGGDFRLVEPPAGTLAPGALTSFAIRFVAAAAGQRAATVEIAFGGERYHFAVQGTGRP